VAAQITEWFLSERTTVFGASPTEGSGGRFNRSNVSRLESQSGHVTLLKLGDARWSAEYLMRDLTEPQRDEILTEWITNGGATKKFFLRDHESIDRWVEWQQDELFFSFVPVLRHNLTLRFQEAIG
jgi:hypothetical protein